MLRHGKEQAYVDLAVRGLEGLRAYVRRMNLIEAALEDCGAVERIGGARDVWFLDRLALGVVSVRIDPPNCGASLR